MGAVVFLASDASALMTGSSWWWTAAGPRSERWASASVEHDGAVIGFEIDVAMLEPDLEHALFVHRTSTRTA